MYQKFLIFVVAVGLSSQGIADEVSTDCLRDLELLPRFLLSNDAGAKAQLQQRGEAYFEDALAEAKQQLAALTTEADCERILDDYLAKWRSDHLSVKNTTAEAVVSNSSAPKHGPELESLSERTVLITIPSFNSRYAAAIDDLLKANIKLLSNHKNWIIDVRKNSGGSDHSFKPLLPWLLADEYVEVGAEFLATEKNFTATRQVCEREAAAKEACLAMINPLLTRMRVANNGDFVSLSDSLIDYKKTSESPAQRPTKVAVLIDKNCGSTCEQFLLAARQSFSVKLIGRNTAGALDYSNLRPYGLPSGKRELMYATSRSARLPIMPVDVAGVMPDIYLAPPVDENAFKEETIRVKNWLEGGSLAPF